MKKSIFICVLGILISSCSNNDISYPATYELESNLELGTTIVTESDSGEIIEVAQIHSLNRSLCDFFNEIQGNQDLASIILLSESELELNFDTGNGTNSSVTLPYTAQDNVILEDLGLAFDEENNITTTNCGEFTFAPSKLLVLAESNFCGVTDHSKYVQSKFISEGFAVGDTLGLCLIQKVYKLR